MSKVQKNSESITPTSAEQFKQEREAREVGKAITLPSGKVVKVKKLSITFMVKNKMFPPDLVNLMMRFQNPTTAGIRNQDEAEKIIQAMEIIIKACMLEPRVVDQPNYDNNEISPDDLEDDDKVFVYQWAQGGLAEAKSFRSEEPNASDNRPDMSNVPEQNA